MIMNNPEMQQLMEVWCIIFLCETFSCNYREMFNKVALFLQKSLLLYAYLVEIQDLICNDSRRSEAKCHPGPPIEVPPFPPLKFAYKNLMKDHILCL